MSSILLLYPSPKTCVVKYDHAEIMPGEAECQAACQILVVFLMCQTLESALTTCPSWTLRPSSFNKPRYLDLLGMGPSFT